MIVSTPYLILVSNQCAVFIGTVGTPCQHLALILVSIKLHGHAEFTCGGVEHGGIRPGTSTIAAHDLYHRSGSVAAAWGQQIYTNDLSAVVDSGHCCGCFGSVALHDDLRHTAVARTSVYHADVLHGQQEIAVPLAVWPCLPDLTGGGCVAEYVGSVWCTDKIGCEYWTHKSRHRQLSVVICRQVKVCEIT